MVEIIKRGEVAIETRQVTCRKCNSELRFKRSEMRYVHDHRDGDALVGKCPVCNTENWASA